MLARRNTRFEASRFRRFSPLQALEDQSQTWGIRCHSCTRREGLAPSWQLSCKVPLPCGLSGSFYFLSTNGSHVSFFSIHFQSITMEEKAHAHPSDSPCAGEHDRGYLVCGL